MISFWNCKDLLAGKEALAPTAKSGSNAPKLQEKSSGTYNVTLTLLPGCSPIPVSYCRITLFGDAAEVSASLLHAIDGSRTLQAGLPLVFRIQSPSWLGPLSRVSVAIDSIAADVRSMFSHVTVSCCDDVRYTFKPQGASAPAPALIYFITDKDGVSSQDFIVHVYTGGDFGAGTDSKISLQVQGVDGDVRVTLQQSLTHADAFERGHHDVFLFSLPPTQRVGEVRIEFESLAPGSDSRGAFVRFWLSLFLPRRAASSPSGSLIT
jgi:hypothetical protein